MSIAVLTQAYDEVRRLAIAGSVVAPGDFRLKKLAQPLEKAGEKAPVFAKVASAINKVVESTEKTSAESLLELSTLINAILYTQGETDATGKLESIETTNLGTNSTRTTARMLKPLLEALTTTGSGRLETIRESFARGVFHDMRLVNPALTALDDHYPEIGEFIAEKVLPLYGKAILPNLRAKFDMKGKGGHVRRLTAMFRLDPEGTGPLVKEALENGSKEMKVAAIACLGTWPGSLKPLLDPLPYLVEQSKAKSQEIRLAALDALVNIESKETIAAFQAALARDDVDALIGPMRRTQNPELRKLVLTEANSQYDALLASKEKDKKAVGKRVQRIMALLSCLEGRDDKACETFLLKVFADQDKLAAIKGDYGGQDIIERLLSVMWKASPRSQNAIVDSLSTLSPNQLRYGFLAASQQRSEAEVFDLFSPYLKTKDQKKKSREAAANRQALTSVLISRQHWIDDPIDDDPRDQAGGTKLDPRWLELAVELDDAVLVRTLARPGSPGANAMLSKNFASSLKKGSDWHECGQILGAMIKAEHPEITDSLVAAIEKCAKGTNIWGLHWLLSLVAKLPKSALPKLENLLPSLPDKAVDQLLGWIEELKKKPD